MKFLKENVPNLVLLAIVTAASFYFYPQLPEQMPTHYDWNGNPDQFSSREFVTVLLPAFYIGILALVALFMNISPAKFAMPNSRMALNRIIFAMGLLFASIHLGMLMEPTYKGVIEKFMSYGMALFLIVAGNVMGKTERNFFIGIRVPWTLASEENWRATHRFAGKMMVVFGVGLFIISFVTASLPVIITGLMVPLIAPVFYSFIYYRKHELPAA